MKILEPILFEGSIHTIVTANTQENEELDLSFAHNEGALIIAARVFFDEGNRVAFADANEVTLGAVRTTDALATDIPTITTSPDTLWIAMLHAQGILESAIGGSFAHYLEGQWMPLPGGGVVISRNPFAEFRHITTGQRPSLAIAFKRVIFEVDELVRFVAQRR